MSNEYTIIHVIKDALTGKLQLAPKETAAYRYLICTECEAFNPKWKQCTVCGCFMPLKTKLKKSSCPMELWEEVK